jgi:DNA-3-methyladenine glycosylase II
MQDTIIECLNRDVRLRPLLESIPFPIPRPAADNLFEDLLRSIVGQQLSVKAAETIFGRFIQLFPQHIPEAHLLDALPDEILRQTGLSRQKCAYIRNAAAFFVGKPTDTASWQTWSDEEILRELTSIKGVGAWTVQMLLMFSLGRPDVLPLADLGIQTAMIRLYGLQSNGKALQAEMGSIADQWRPYRSYACFYLWKWKDLP